MTLESLEQTHKTEKKKKKKSLYPNLFSENLAIGTSAKTDSKGMTLESLEQTHKTEKKKKKKKKKKNTTDMSSLESTFDQTAVHFIRFQLLYIERGRLPVCKSCLGLKKWLKC